MKFIKLKKSHLILVICIINLLILQTIEVQNKWCWTHSMANDMNFQLDPQKGGINWGYCQPNPVANDINYHISLITSKGTKAKLTIMLFGEKGSTEEETLVENTKIDDGTTTELDLNARNVGEIRKVQLKLYGNDIYKCQKLQIVTQNTLYSFDCIKKLEPCTGFDFSKCKLMLESEGDHQYEVTIRANEEEGSGTKLPILFSIIGTNGQSPFGILAEDGVEDGQATSKMMLLDDVGTITGFTVKIEDEGSFSFKYISILNVETEEIKEFEVGNIKLNNPGNNFYTFDDQQGSNGKKGPKISPEKATLSSLFTQENEDDISNPSEQAESSFEDPNEIQEEENNTPKQESTATSSSPKRGKQKSKNGFNVNDPDGGVMNPNEKTKIMDLTCTQTLENPSETNLIFGPNFVDGMGNYLNFLARCPGNCHKEQGFVEGLGIHPESSPICLSAMVDKAISYYGGIISISVFPGIDSYPIIDNPNFKNEFPNIDLSPINEKASRSYSVAKVDNVDLIEKDIRILNHEGKISREGRVEFRINGKWGSICAIDLNAESAIRICKDLGYLHGIWLNNEPAAAQNNEFCRNYKGNDYCGAEGQPAYFKAVKCSEGDNSINQCNKEMAFLDECPRSKDALILCDNTDVKVGEPIPNGVIRLENPLLNSDSVIGRVEMAKNKEFLPVCGSHADNIVANIVCKDMGYSTGNLVVDKEERKKYTLDNEDQTEFAAGKITCLGSESSLKLCSISYDGIDCKHSEDLIVKCTGSNGDYTGKSQYPTPPIPDPSLGKLGLIKQKISCKDTFEKLPISKGDVGSIMVVTCNSFCSNSKEPLIGTGLYRGDSSICKAATHSGIITKERATDVLVVKTYSLSKYYGINKSGLSSTSSDIDIGSAFTLFTMNSGWYGMGMVFKMSSSYLELGYNIQASSFVELQSKQEEYPPSIFNWIEEDRTHRFTQGDKNGLLITNKVTETIKAFTILLRVTLTQTTSNRQFILSSKSCGGFNVYLEKNEIILGDPCDEKKRVKTDLTIGENDNTIIYIAFKKNEINIKLFPKSYPNSIKRTIYYHSFELRLYDYVGIGRATETGTLNFEGNIDYIFIFKDEVSIDRLGKLVDDLDSLNFSLKPKTEDNSLKMITLDGRDCITPCLLMPIPGEENAPDAPPDAKAETESSFEISDTNSPNYIIYGEKNGQVNEINSPEQASNNDVKNASPAKQVNKNDKFAAISNLNSNAPIKIECDTDLYDPRLYDSLAGKKYALVKCPKCNLNNPPLVFGSEIYHPLSSICSSALHKGIESEYIKVTKREGFPIYNGSYGKNGIESLTIGKSDHSYTVEEGVIPNQLKCKDTIEMLPYSEAAAGDKFLINCPKDCLLNNNMKVYGTDIYSSNSPICLAAIHNGIFSRTEGGEVEITILSPSTTYKGSKGVGIISYDLIEEKKGFKFLENLQSGAYDQEEKFEGSIGDQWIQVKSKDLGEECVNDFWEYSEQIEISVKNEGQKVKSIKHTSETCKIRNQIDYASLLLLKKSSLSRGVYTVNFKLDDMENTVGFIFGYVNEDKYYSIIIKPNSMKNNVILLEKQNSNIKQLDARYIEIKQNEWYTIRIQIDKNKITVYINPLLTSEKIKRFDLLLSDAISGMVGIGVNGNNNCMFNGVKVSSEIKEEKHILMDNEKRTFNSFISRISLRDYKMGCEYGTKKVSKLKEKIECPPPEVYCEKECDKEISPIENILHYQCASLCRTKIGLEMKKEIF